MKIYEQKHGSMNESDRLALATLLIKAGYTVSVKRERPPGKQSGWVHYVEYDGEKTAHA